MNQRVLGGIAAFSLGVCLTGSGSARAAEHGGKEHGGTSATPAVSATQEHGGQAEPIAPSAEQIRQTIRDHVQQIIQRDGTFAIHDEATGADRQLELIRVHERVGKTGELYYSCTDMRDTSTGQTLDLDYDVEATADGLQVVDVRIHKVEGQARYTYDDQDQRIPVVQ